MTDWLYYTVGTVSTTNKLTAVEAAGGDMSRVHFYFADREHGLHDWTQEPEQTLTDLIDQRVSQLRDQNNYLCLWYSGGYDSQTILDSFVRTNTRLDEILIYDRQWIDQVHNMKEDKLAYAYACSIKKNHQPWLRIRVVQYDPQAIFDFYQHHGNDWIYHDRGSFPGFTKQNRANTAQWQKEFRSLAQQPGRLDINGVEKPRVNLVDGKWYAQMSDRTLYYFFDCPYELFYISPAATEIYIKQCYMVIDWMEQQPGVSHNWVHRVQSNDLGPEIYAEWNRACGRSSVHNKIASGGLYKHLLGNGVDAVEGRALISAVRTQHETVFKHWHHGLTNLQNRFAYCWNPKSGFDTVMSQAIYLRDQKPADSNIKSEEHRIMGCHEC